jgi:hypothetical protein
MKRHVGFSHEKVLKSMEKVFGVICEFSSLKIILTCWVAVIKLRTSKLVKKNFGKYVDITEFMRVTR